ncbi:MAG: DUF1573 domain-containing protein [Acidobacteriota bacterium]
MTSHSRTQTIAFTLLASLALLLTSTASAQVKHPKLVISETNFNAGQVPRGDVINKDFIVKNEGEGDLNILTVKPSCGCTTPGYDKIIKAGTTGKITLKVDTAKFKGPITKSASVTTNDPSQPNFRLVVSANVQTFVDVLPRDLVSIRQFRGEEKKETVTIHSNESGPFEIKEVQVDGDHIKHALEKADGDSGDYELTVWVDEDAKVGNISGTLRLLTNSAKEPQVTVKVRGNVMPQIVLNPASLYFRVDGGAANELEVDSATLNVRKRGELKAPIVAEVKKGARLDLREELGDWMKVRTEDGKEGWVFSKFVKKLSSGGEAVSKTLNVSHRQAGKFQIKSADVKGAKIEPADIDIETSALADGERYQLTVVYNGGLEKGSYTGKVVLTTTDADEPSVEVPLYIVVT